MLIIIVFIKTGLHIAIGTIIKHRQLRNNLADNLVTFG